MYKINQSGYFLKITLSRYNSHIIQFTHLKVYNSTYFSTIGTDSFKELLITIKDLPWESEPLFR